MDIEILDALLKKDIMKTFDFLNDKHILAAICLCMDHKQWTKVLLQDNRKCRNNIRILFKYIEKSILLEYYELCIADISLVTHIDVQTFIGNMIKYNFPLNMLLYLKNQIAETVEVIAQNKSFFKKVLFYSMKWQYDDLFLYMLKYKISLEYKYKDFQCIQHAVSSNFLIFCEHKKHIVKKYGLKLIHFLLHIRHEYADIFIDMPDINWYGRKGKVNKLAFHIIYFLVHYGHVDKLKKVLSKYQNNLQFTAKIYEYIKANNRTIYNLLT